MSRVIGILVAVLVFIAILAMLPPWLQVTLAIGWLTACVANVVWLNRKARP